jgi:hypothetical protein
MSDLVTDTLRKTMRAMADIAPDAPPLTAIPAPTRRSRRHLLVAAGVFAAVLATGGVTSHFLAGGITPTPPIGTPEKFVTTTVASVPQATVSDSAGGETIPLDGRPEDLGVKAIDFITALFPTTPKEHRENAAWDALRINVESSWVESCMAGSGFSIELPRVTALEVRRNADMPDFELDAEYGIFESRTDTTNYVAAPPGEASDPERARWQVEYAQCNLQVEAKRSTEFDQVIGQITPFWWDSVREINASEDMTKVTTELLTCVSDGGGPEATTIRDLYSDRLTMGASSSEEARSSWQDRANLIASCAGNYSQVRQGLLIPIRDQIVTDYPDLLAEARSYFDEVVAAAG